MIYIERYIVEEVGIGSTQKNVTLIQISEEVTLVSVDALLLISAVSCVFKTVC